MNTEFKGKRNTCRKYGHKQNRLPDKNKNEEGEGNKKFFDTCNHCSKVGHKSTNRWKHENNKDKTPKNWKEKEDT